MYEVQTVNNNHFFSPSLYADGVIINGAREPTKDSWWEMNSAQKPRLVKIKPVITKSVHKRLPTIGENL